MREPEHELKTWPDSFQAVWDRRKTAEFRKNDRKFRVGDILSLAEYNPDTNSFSGRRILALITHVAASGFNIPEGWCMLSILVLACDSKPRPAMFDRMIQG